MLHELFTFLTTPCPAYARRLRYLHEAIATRARYHRHRRAWQPHLDRTRALLLAAAERCESRESVAVYGAGLLHDVPLAELAARFRQVYLLDIVFLRETTRKARRFGNVTLVQHDATQVAEAFCHNLRQGLAELPEPDCAPPECVRGADLVISLNLLSQLWVMPSEYVADHLRDFDEERLDAWCRRVVDAHYAMLRSLGGRVCLVADHAYVERDKAGTIVESGSTIHGLALPEPDAAWIWQIAPLGESARDRSTELSVGAWHLR